MRSSRTTDSESRRLIREELLTNVLVEAGAGSGKTQMLAERMAAGVAAGVYEIEHMAAVTFTRKAASELRGRFHLALEQQLKMAVPGVSHSAQSQRIERLQHALANLEQFFAGTIHAFCARLLRERPVESGVAPGFTELDEVQDLELRQRVWRDFITSARSAGDPDMLALLEADVRPKDLDGAFATMCLHEDVEFPPGNADYPDLKPAVAALEKFWKSLQKHLPAPISTGTTCPLQKAARQFQGQLRVSRFRMERPAVVAALLQTWNREFTIVQKWWADDPREKQRFKRVIGELHGSFLAETVQPYIAQWRQYVYRLTVTVLSRARQDAARERRRLNRLNYGDLLNLSASALRQSREVRVALRRKYRHLFVDEFQDTDPVQAEILFQLAAEDSAHDPDWRVLPLRPGALFVVGDPKQSIYRFRRADIDIYNIVRARFEDPTVGRVVTLTMNFRAVPALCAWANDVFKTRFPARPTTHSPQFAPLDPRDEKTRASGGLFVLTHSCEHNEVLQRDAEKIARYIRTEVDAGRRAFSDFLILTRKKRDRIVPYAEALEALNIPIEVGGAGAFGESEEVEALSVLLRALADPQDALSLVAVLRGPLFGISDPELFAFKQAGGWFNLFCELEHQGEQARRVSDALKALRQFHRWTRLLPAGAALDRILEHTGYLALAATTPGGVEAGDLLHAVDRVRQVVEEGGSLDDAAEALEADREATSEVESLPLEPGRTNVVRVMNLHKAKGLEASVVFLADPTGGYSPRVDVHIERKGLQAQGWFPVIRRSETSFATTLLGKHKNWPAHEAAELPYLQAEEDRLLYVAATRARELLVVSRFTGKNGVPAWGVLNNFLSDAKELPVPHTSVTPRVRIEDSSTRSQASAEAARAAAHDVAKQPSWAITSVTAESRHIARMTRAAETVADDPTKVVGTSTPAHRADAGIAWGTLIHGLLEHAMRHPSATRDDLRRLALWLTVEEQQLRQVIDDALDTVSRVAHSEFWEHARSHEHSVETPFMVHDSTTRLTNGVVDLLVQSQAGWRIVDYKTELNLPEGAYEGQLRAYREALRKLGCEVSDASVVNVRTKDNDRAIAHVKGTVGGVDDGRVSLDAQ